MSSDSPLRPALVEGVLAKLGFDAAPAVDLAGLASLYDAWCRSVPFDNLQKLIHIGSANPAPLPGDTPEEFFEAWLADGAGGTCWAGNGALASLLSALGFAARRAIATMLVAPNLPPNHGSVSVALDGGTWLADASMLHGSPLRLDPAKETEVPHPAWGLRARPDCACWIVTWRAAHRAGGLDCRIDSLDGTARGFRELHEQTRTWSPFNFQLHARVNRGDGVVSVSGDQRTEYDASGAVHTSTLDAEGRTRFLVEELGVSEELAARVPEDRPMPPPPGARTAAGT
ncbi:MAG: arylamine N-acetyltransferase [Myxococcota bacterium]